MKPKIITLGVYGFDESDFFDAIVRAGVDTFCDVRARRGLRGVTYTFVNSQYLQNKLETLGIRYVHMKHLAPSDAVREAQDVVDKLAKVARRARAQLSDAFINAYTQDVLSDLDANKDWLQHLPVDTKTCALFCVEGQPEACHRSLLATYLANELSLEVEHVTR